MTTGCGFGGLPYAAEGVTACNTVVLALPSVHRHLFCALPVRFACVR